MNKIFSQRQKLILNMTENIDNNKQNLLNMTKFILKNYKFDQKNISY